MQGDLIEVRIRAVNLIGDSLDSSVNSAGALVEKVPSAPPVAPLRNLATDMTSVTVDFYPLIGTSIGGAPILSYEL